MFLHHHTATATYINRCTWLQVTKRRNASNQNPTEETCQHEQNTGFHFVVDRRRSKILDHWKEKIQSLELDWEEMDVNDKRVANILRTIQSKIATPATNSGNKIRSQFCLVQATVTVNRSQSTRKRV